MKLITADNFPKALLIMIVGIWICIVTINLFSSNKIDTVSSKLIEARIKRQDSIIDILELQKQSYYKILDSLKKEYKITEIKTNTIKNHYYEKLDTIYRVPVTPKQADSILTSWKLKDRTGYYNLPR